MEEEIQGSVMTPTTVTPRQTTVIDPRSYIQSQDNFINVKGLNIYDFMLKTYHGTDGYVSGYYLVPFLKENYYEDRCRTAVYTNIFRPIVDAMITPVFEKEPERIINDNLFKLFVDNADNAGTSLTDFTEMTMTNARVCGLTFVVVDNHAFEEQKTVQETISGRLYPYLYEKIPSEIHEIQTDKYGSPLSYIFLEGGYKVGDKTYQLYREWTAYDTTLYYVKKSTNGVAMRTIVENRVHDLGQIPVIAVNNFLKSKKIDTLPQPVLYNLAMLNFSLYNKETYIQELEKNQCFSILVTQGIDPKMLKVGPTNFINVPIDAPNLPEYISPNTDNTRVLVENCNRLREEIYQEAGQKGVYIVKEQQSGIAKEWDFRSEEAILKETSKAASAFEERVAEIYGLYLNKVVTCESKYPMDFSPQYYDERVLKLLEIIKELPPATLADALWEEIAQITFKQMPDRAQEIVEKMKADVAVQKELNGEPVEE